MVSFTRSNFSFLIRFRKLTRQGRNLQMQNLFLPHNFSVIRANLLMLKLTPPCRSSLYALLSQFIVNYYIHIWVNNLFWFINILSKYILFNWIIMMPLHILRYLYLYLPNFLDLWNDSQNHSCGLEKWILKPTGKIPLYLTRWAEILIIPLQLI